MAKSLSPAQKAQKEWQEKNKKPVKGKTYDANKVMEDRKKAAGRKKYDAKQTMSDRTYERIRQHETGEKPFSSEAEYQRVKSLYNRRLNARG